MAEGAYRVSDTFPIRIRVRHAPDTYLRSIRFFINFAIFEYACGYVSVFGIRPSPTKTMSPRRSHLVRSRRLQRTRARKPRPCSPVTGDEPPPPLAGRRRRASVPRSLETSLRPRTQPPAYMCAASCAGDAPLLAGRRRRASGPSMPSSSSRSAQGSCLL